MSRSRRAGTLPSDELPKASPLEEERPPVKPRVVLRNAAVAWGGEIVAKASSLAFFAVMARELGGSGFGDFIFALSLTSLLVLAAGLGTDSLLEREVARDRGQAVDYVRAITGLKALVATGLVVAATAGVHLAGYSSDAQAAVFLVGAGVVLEHLSKTRYAAFMAFEVMKHMSFSIVVQRTATAVVGVVLLLAGAGLVTVSVVFVCGALVGLVLSEVSFHRMVAGVAVRRQRLRWSRLARTAFPIGVSSLLFTLLLKFDAVLLGFLANGVDNAEVGYFGGAYRVVEATMFLSWYLSAAIMPYVARAGEGSGDLARGYEVALKAVTALLLPLAVTFAVLAEPLVHTLYGDGYERAVLPLQLLSAMTVLYGINYLASTFFVGRDRPEAFGRLLVGVLIQNVVCNIVLIPRFGADAAAFNAALSGLLLAGLGFWKAHDVVGPVRTGRALTGPLVAGAAMAGAMVAVASTPLLSVAVGVLIYPVVLIALEMTLFPSDLDLRRRLDAVRRARRGQEAR